MKQLVVSEGLVFRLHYNEGQRLERFAVQIRNTPLYARKERIACSL